MHYTLTPRGNIPLIALMAIALSLCLFLGNGASLAVIAIFSLAGLVAGLLQARSIYNDRSKFLSANTALEVRAALTSSTAGKLSIALLWLSGFALIALLFRGGEYATVQTMVGSYATFSLVRESAALPALFALRSWARSG